MSTKHLLLAGLLLLAAGSCPGQALNFGAPRQAEEALGLEADEVTARWQTNSLAVVWQAAESGDRTAQYFLGWASLEGKGVPVNLAEGFRWNLKAAEAGLPDAMFRVGYLYSRGAGVALSRANSTSWYHRAAEAGVPGAQYNYGQALQFGSGIAQNVPEAFQWFAKAAKAGVPLAQTEVGEMLFTGEGTPIDRVAAANWFRLAADHGYREARFALAEMYAAGEADPRHQNESSITLYRQAAEQGHPLAQLRLAERLRYGYAVPRDWIESCQWYLAAAQREEADALMVVRTIQAPLPTDAATNSEPAQFTRVLATFIRAAGRGDAQALYAVGEMYHSGRDVPKDAVKACLWFGAAAQRGSSEAADRRTAILKDLSPQEVERLQRLSKPAPAPAR